MPVITPYQIDIDPEWSPSKIVWHIYGNSRLEKQCFPKRRVFLIGMHDFDLSFAYYCSTKEWWWHYGLFNAVKDIATLNPLRKCLRVKELRPEFRAWLEGMRQALADLPCDEDLDEERSIPDGFDFDAAFEALPEDVQLRMSLIKGRFQRGSVDYGG